ncbi:hypothetical protein RBA41_28260 [Massilia sp. CCM 9210]|uniref:hypothetical protein n=1 Tax=Massilia scottii TaxID=3057166 RepID=UPI002796C7C6|nr:hypothetical protein [Massilia sp. CCM 9210]MDQ1817204.1 hypothetical protein [Massilia sp. CCM 9210]
MVAGLLPLIAFAALSVVTIIVLAWYAKKGLDEIFKKPNVEARVYIPTPEELAEDAKKKADAAAAGKAEADRKAADANAAAEMAADDATTILAKAELDCGESGSYGALLKKNGKNKYDRDHIPSKAALQKAALDQLDERQIELTDKQAAVLFGPYGMISKAGATVVTLKNDHRLLSETYGSKNNVAKIEQDAKELQLAAIRDAKAIQNGANEMDAKCQKKYKNSTKKITSKTHAQYISEINAMIDGVRKIPVKK